MKRAFTFLLSISFLFIMNVSAAAAPLNGGAATLKNGGGAAAAEWVKQDDQVNGSIDKSKLAKMKAVTTALVNFLHDTCALSAGMTPSWYGAYNSGRSSSGRMVTYGLNCNFGDAKAALTVKANELAPLMGRVVLGGQVYLTMDMPKAVQNGANYYEYTGTDGLTVKRWLITRSEGEQPYTAVSRREYLQASIHELIDLRARIVEDVKLSVQIRSKAAQEAEKNQMLDRLAEQYTGEALEVHEKEYLANYMTDEQSLQAAIDRETRHIDDELQLMNGLLERMSAAQLAQPAVVSVAAVDFNGFEDGHTDRMLVHINAAYFNCGLTEEKAQLFLVEFTYDAAASNATDIDRQLEASMDSQALRNLLGK